MADGGNVEFVEIDGLVVKLKLQGACGSCPSSLTTMTMGIKRRLMEKIPVSNGLAIYGLAAAAVGAGSSGCYDLFSVHKHSRECLAADDAPASNGLQRQPGLAWGQPGVCAGACTILFLPADI